MIEILVIALLGFCAAALLAFVYGFVSEYRRLSRPGDDEHD